MKEYKEQILEVFTTHFSDYTYNIISDIESAYFGALGDCEGIVMICGTGSIGLAYKNDEFKRCGGYGPTFSDEGSAYYIGKSLISKFFRQSDGRDEKSLLYTEVKKYFNIDYDYDILKILGNNRQAIANLANLCYNCAIKSDENAIDIFKDTGACLASIVNTLAKDFDSVNVSFIGGVTKSFDILFEYIKNNSSDNINFVKPRNSSEYGAVLAFLKKDSYEN